jgi:preprotein translocase subunit SecY
MIASLTAGSNNCYVVCGALYQRVGIGGGYSFLIFLGIIAGIPVHFKNNFMFNGYLSESCTDS